MSKTRTAAATARAPGVWKTIEIQAGASSKTHVMRPGEASKSRSPNWVNAWWSADAGRSAGIVAIDSIVGCPGAGNSRGPRGLLDVMENMKHFDGPTFEADVLKASGPGVVCF